MNEDTLIAPGASEVRGWPHRALAIAVDTAIAVALVWSLPLALALVAALLRLAVSSVR